MDSSPHHFQTGESPVHRGFAAPQLMRDTTVQFSCNPLSYGYFASPTTESQTGQSAHQKANHPSQATTSLGASLCRGHNPHYLHCATTHKSRLHQMAGGFDLQPPAAMGEQLAVRENGGSVLDV